MGRKAKKIKAKRPAKKKTTDGIDANSTGDGNEVKPSKYTVDQLIERAEEYIDTFEFDLAQKFCQRALEMEPDNIRVLQTSGTLLLELGQIENAKCCFGRAIELEPDTGHSKYMYMGQLMTGVESVQCFTKGIDLMKERLQQQSSQADSAEGAAAAVDPSEDSKDNKKVVTVRDISQAHCSIAEIYLTDACFVDEAEAQCKCHLEQAVQTDPSNGEAYHLTASYWLSMDNKQAAAESLEKGLSLWLPQLKEAHSEEGEGSSNTDPVQVCQISYPGRINASKLLIELEKYEEAADVLELLLDEDDEVVEVWYLLGWSHHLQGKDYKGNARYYLQKAQEVAKKVKCDDKDMVGHINDLLNELGPEEEEEVEENNDCEENDLGDSDMDMDNDKTESAHTDKHDNQMEH